MFITNSEKLRSFASCHRVWQGIPGIARTRKGRTFVSFYSGAVAETYGNYAVLLKSDSDADFGEPIAVALKEGNFRCFDPVLWIDPLERLWFIWNVMPGEEVCAAICADPDADALQWSEPFCIGRGIMMNKPTVLKSGEWLFPIAIWKLDTYRGFRESGLESTDVAGSYVYKTSDNGQTFQRLGMADVRNRSFDEHMVLEQENGVLQMLVRTTYGIGASYSYDRGKTWSAGENSGLGGPCSRFFIRRLRSGNVLLINHVNFIGRNNLTALLSTDDGKTFPYALLLDGRSQVSYPDAQEGEDGAIYIVYDRERGCFKSSLQEAYACAREILTAKITEEDILRGSIGEGSYLQNVVSKLGLLAPEDADPYREPISDTEKFLDQVLQEGGDILEKVFARYPLNCVDLARLESEKMDELIDLFHKTGDSDKKLLLKIIDLIQRTPRSAENHSPIVLRIMEHIQAHLTEEISVSDMAQAMHINVYYLAHLFKSATGISITEYRNELRLTMAKQLLIGSKAPIHEIAAQCGFSNASYFGELFFRSERISPSQFRKYHS